MNIAPSIICLFLFSHSERDNLLRPQSQDSGTRWFHVSTGIALAATRSVPLKSRIAAEPQTLSHLYYERRYSNALTLTTLEVI